MKMFGFSRRRMKIGRLKVQLSDSAQGTPMRHPKRYNTNNDEGVTPSSNESDEYNFCQASGVPELSNCTSGSSENWMVLSITGEKPTPRFNHAAAVVGNKMVVVGGESTTEMLEDVQVLDFDRFSWSKASSNLHLSPTSLPLKIPSCKGHSLISWGKKVLLIGGKADPSTEKLSVSAFDTDTECWSHLEAKGDIPVSRSGHTVVRASSVLILFGGEDSRRRKLNDLHMFDLKSLTWLPLSCTGSGPSPRSNHVAALYDEKLLLVFGGSSKSRTLNDLYSLDFEKMIWSRIKVRDFHPSPRSGCCGVLYGSKWYITGGSSRKKRHAETLVFDVLRHEWSTAVSSPPSSVTTNKGFSLVLVQHKERDFLVAFGGLKKDPSNQVEILIVERTDSSLGRKSTLSKRAGTFMSSGAQDDPVSAVARQNLASAIEKHGSGRRSLSESLHADPNSLSLRKQFYNDGVSSANMLNGSEDQNPSQMADQKIEQLDGGTHTKINSDKHVREEMRAVHESRTMNNHHRHESASHQQEMDDLLQESDFTLGTSATLSLHQLYEAKLGTLIRKNGLLEGQLAAALGSRDAAEKNLSFSLKGKQDAERKLADVLKEVEFLKEKLAGLEVAQEEANSLSNIVHSDNVRLEHDVAFLKAVLDDTQKELHSTRGVLAGERARTFQLQVEVFHLKQRLQSLENRATTPRKPFHV